MALAADALPRLDDLVRDAIAWLPQPVAEAVAAIEAAHDPQQARDAVWEVVHVVARLVGVLALAGQTRVADAAAPIELLREVHRRELADDEWLALARALAAPHAATRDAYPVPELIDLVLAEPSPFDALLTLRGNEGATTTEGSVRDRV